MNRKARTLVLLAIIMLLSLLAPAAALAQGVGTDEDGLLLRINGPVTVAQGETVENVIVIGDNATVDGTITGSLLVLNGDATVNGEVGQDVAVVGGALNLTSSAQVENVSIIRGDLAQDPAATVTGSVTESEFQVSPWDWGIAWALFWLGTTIVFLVAGLVFAGIGGRQLSASGSSIVDQLGPTLLGVIVLWILIPIVMIAALLTVIGIPLGIGYFLFVLPVLWFLGYLVAGTLLGRLIVRSQRDADHPYLAALVGILLLQILSIIPVFGWMISFIAALLGSGGLVVIAWHAWRGRRAEPEPAPEEGGAHARA